MFGLVVMVKWQLREDLENNFGVCRENVDFWGAPSFKPMFGVPQFLQSKLKDLSNKKSVSFYFKNFKLVSSKTFLFGLKTF